AGAGGCEGGEGKARKRGLSAGLAEACRSSGGSHLPGPRPGAGAAPAGRTLYRVPTRSAEDPQGPLCVRGRLRRRGDGLHPDRQGLSRRGLRANSGSGRPLRETAGADHDEVTAAVTLGCPDVATSGHPLLTVSTSLVTGPLLRPEPALPDAPLLGSA